MKKKEIAAFAVAAALALTQTACGQTAGAQADASQETKTEASKTPETPAETDTEPEETEGTAPLMEEDKVTYVASDYVTLGKYLGINVQIPVTAELTDADVSEEIDRRIRSAGGVSYEPVDRDTVQMGDVVNIDYVGTKDGVAFDGGTASGYMLTIGSGQFIDGFEDGLVGAKVGETRELNLTFPEQYHSAELAGQDVVFTVTVNEINEAVTMDQDTLTDDFVEKNFGASSVDVWKESVRMDMEAEQENDLEQEKRDACMEELRKTCKIKSLPDGLLEERKRQARETYQMQADANGVDLATLLSFYGMTEETLDQWIEEYIPQDTEDELIKVAIADDLGLDENSPEFKDYIDELLENGFESEEQIYSIYPKSYVLRLFKQQAALDRVTEEAHFTETEEAPSSEETESEE